MRKLEGERGGEERMVHKINSKGEERGEEIMRCNLHGGNDLCDANARKAKNNTIPVFIFCHFSPFKCITNISAQLSRSSRAPAQG